MTPCRYLPQDAFGKIREKEGERPKEDKSLAFGKTPFYN
jgi:hypothetical protein